MGNLEAKRDWGFAGDYVEAMWLMLQQDKPDDYIICTGICYSVKDFLIKVFDYLNLDWKEHIKIDAKYFRPSEVDLLCGNNTKARKKLGWEPKADIDDLVKMMVDSDMEIAKREKIIRDS